MVTALAGDAFFLPKPEWILQVYLKISIILNLPQLAFACENFHKAMQGQQIGSGTSF